MRESVEGKGKNFAEGKWGNLSLLLLQQRQWWRDNFYIFWHKTSEFMESFIDSIFHFKWARIWRAREKIKNSLKYYHCCCCVWGKWIFFLFLLQNEKWDTWNFHLQQRLGRFGGEFESEAWGKLREKKTVLSAMLHNSAFWCMEDKNIFILNSSSQGILFFIPFSFLLQPPPPFSAWAFSPTVLSLMLLVLYLAFLFGICCCSLCF